MKAEYISMEYIPLYQQSEQEKFFEFFFLAFGFMFSPLIFL